MAEPAVGLGDKGLTFEDALFEVQKAQDVIGEQDGELKRIVTGYAAVAEVVDSQYEVITKEALDGASQDLLHYTTVLYNHDPDRPIGKVLEARPEGNGLFVKVQISGTENEIWDKICEGIISKFSFRGTVTDYAERFEKSLDRYVTVIKAFRIVEISLVSVPANPHAKTLHHYLSKALEHISKDSQSHGNTGEGEDKTPRKGGPSKTMDRRRIRKSDDDQQLQVMSSLCDKLLAALQDMPHVDARVVAVAHKLKEMLAGFKRSEAGEPDAGGGDPGHHAAHGGGDDSGGGSAYPQPSANALLSLELESFDPKMESVKKRLEAAEEKLVSMEKSLGELSETLTTSITEAVKGMTETMVNERMTQLDEKFDLQTDVIKSFAELLDSLRPALGLAPAVIEKTEDAPAKTEDQKSEGGDS